MQVTGLRPKIVAAADGRGVVGHAGARLLADLADATGLSAAFSDALGPLRVRQSGHDPGRVASDPTAWRLLSDLDGAALSRLRGARARARELVWAQAAETGTGMPGSTAAGVTVPGLVLDLDASLVICHSDKESAKPTYNR